jgi:hypothetical protein
MGALLFSRKVAVDSRRLRVAFVEGERETAPRHSEEGR